MWYERTDFEWTAIRSFLPNKPRGIPRVDDRRALNGIFWFYTQGDLLKDENVRLAPRAALLPTSHLDLHPDVSGLATEPSS